MSGTDWRALGARVRAWENLDTDVIAEADIGAMRALIVERVEAWGDIGEKKGRDLGAALVRYEDASAAQSAFTAGYRGES